MPPPRHDEDGEKSWFAERLWITKTLEDLRDEQKDLADKLRTVELQIAKWAGLYAIGSTVILEIIVESVKAALKHP